MIERIVNQPYRVGVFIAVFLTVTCGLFNQAYAQCPLGGTITIEINTDDYGYETSWQIRNQVTNALVASVGTFSYGDNSFYTQQVCVDANQCYYFEISDLNGDGMCCFYGLGSYTIRYNGAVVYTGGFFPGSELTANIGNCGAVGGTPLVTSSSTYTPSQLVTDVLLGSCVEAFNVQYTGWLNAIGNFSNGAGIGMDAGVLLTTGSTVAARGPNDVADESIQALTPGDLDLANEAGTTLSTFDAASLEFDFVSFNDTVTFRYIFASEEYPEYVCSNYNDAFAFLVTGAGYAPNTNIALIPGTNVPVAINSVNNGTPGALAPFPPTCTSLSNTAYYVANFGDVTEYDAYTVPLTATMVVVPCDTYHIKLVVADVADRLYDSGVFLQAQSFSGGQSVQIQAADGTGSKNTLETCMDGRFTFTREDTNDIATPITLYYTVSGIATEGVDYTSIPDSIVIPANQISASLFIHPVDDGISEGGESVILSYQDQCACNQFKRDTIFIYDNPQLTLNLSVPTDICVGDSIILSSFAFGSVSRPYNYLWSNGGTTADITIAPTTTTTYTLTVTDRCLGQMAVASRTVNVGLAEAIINVTSPQCFDQNDFDFDNTGAHTGTAAYIWNMGDNTTLLTEDVMNYSYANPGTYNVQLVVFDQGCMDTAVTTVTLLDTFLINRTASICPGDSVFAGGAWQFTGGTYTDAFTAQNGCDSTIVTVVTYLQYQNQTRAVAICPGDSFFVGGAWRFGAGAFLDTLLSSIGGCDTILTTTITVDPYVTATATASICPNDSIFLGGAFRNTAGAYLDTIPALIGCDTVLTTTLTIDPYVTATATASICPNDSILLGGAFRNTAGAYLDTIPALVGCDTVLTTTLIIVPYVTATATASICPNDSIFLGGAFRNTAGAYIDTIPALVGCDTVLTTTLTIDPYITATATANICQDDSILLGGAYQTAAGAYVDTITALVGCDTILTTTLIIDPYVLAAATAAVCQDDSIFLGGAWQTTAGAYIDTVTALVGCDTILTTTLTINPYIIAAENAAICDHDSIFLGGAWQDTAGAYIDTITALTGCDTILTTTLIIISTLTDSVDVVLCAGDSVLAGGSYQMLAGVYVDTFTATTTGCDSIVTTRVVVNDTFTTNIPVTICPGDSVLAGGAWQTVAGVYYDYLQSALGCDSTIITTLVINNIVHGQRDIALCEGDSLFAGGAWRFTSGVFIDTFVAGVGCDSVVTTTLTINDTSVTTVAQRICEGDSVLAGGAWQTQTGQYIDTLQSAQGCDSTVILNLTVDTTIRVFDSLAICAGESHFAGGALQAQSGVYQDTFIAVSTGCDSILTTALTVLDTFLNTPSVFICPGDSYFVAGAWQTQAGVYIDSLNTVLGCDSVIITTITIQAIINVPLNITLCAGDSAQAGGAWQTQSGVYVDSFTAAGGCDSLVTTTIVVHDTFRVDNPVTRCEGESYFAGGALQTTSGTYIDFLQSVHGCDSTVITVLVFDTIIFETTDTTICAGESLFAGGALQTSSGVYVDTLVSTSGCDSIHTTTLTVDTVLISGFDTTICEGQTATLFVTQSFYSYAWLPGGESTPTIDAKGGVYTLTVSDSICTDDAVFNVTAQSVSVDAYAADSTIIRGQSTNIIVQGGSNQLTYDWSPLDGLNCTVCGETAVSTPFDDIFYTIIVTDDLGCTDTTTVEIIVDTIPLPRLYAPNVFTPNGDGVNDEFEVHVEYSLTYHLLIFNRWGEKVFETYNPQEGWNGEYNGKACNPGVYVYFIDVTFINEFTPKDLQDYVKGSVTLMR